MEKKIGILTFCDSYNHGAALQAFATYKYLNDLGYDCMFINYRNKEEKKLYQPISYLKAFDLKTNVKRVVKNTILFGNRNGKKGFSSFYSTLPKTRAYTEENIVDFDSREKFDLVMIGSDQVWNPEICGGKMDLNFWGDFSQKPKISFSSSCGSYLYSEEQGKLIQTKLQTFKSISVREEHTRTQLLNIGIKNDIKVLADPVTLICKEDWEKIVEEKSDISIRKDKYIVVYLVTTKYEACIESIKYIKQKYSYKVVFVNIYNLYKEEVDIYCRKSTPFDFVKLIANAECVITDSFHAVVFSTIFHKNFFYVYNRNMKRVDNLLEKLGISSRTICQVEDTKHLLEYPINYKNVHNIFEEEELKARRYIENAVNKC